MEVLDFDGSCLVERDDERLARLVTVEVAYRAAVEFLHTPTLPPSVKWFEL